MTQRNGIFAENLRLKVTGEPKNFSSVTRIPCQAGFKGKNNWVNRWVDVVWFSKNGAPPYVAKGDIIFVSGRWQETEREYNGKKYEGREVLADSITMGQSQGRQQAPAQGGWENDSVPF